MSTAKQRTRILGIIQTLESMTDEEFTDAERQTLTRIAALADQLQESTDKRSLRMEEKL